MPYRFDLSATEVPLPLAQFQGVDADESGTRKLIDSLNAARNQPTELGRLNRIFQRWWPDMEARIRAVPVGPDRPQPRIGERPANVFWLGHDLARAIRFAMFEAEKRDNLEENIRQALHHLDQTGLTVPDARRLLLEAIKTHRRDEPLSDVARKAFVNALARAKNEIGDRIGRLHSGFRGYPTLDELDSLERDIANL